MTKIAKITIVSLVLFFTAGCNVSDASTINTGSSNNNNNFTNQDSQGAMTSMGTNLAKAKVAAESWNKNASFTALNFVVPGDLNPQSLSQTFVFGSVEDPDNWFTYSIDFTGKFIRAIIPKTDFLGPDLQTIQESYIKKSYVEILRTADDNGGTAYKAEHPETKVTVTLTQGTPNNWTWYVVEYRSATDAQNIRISANNGLVYSDTGTLITK